jgi:hypothetical protein
LLTVPLISAAEEVNAAKKKKKKMFPILWG